MPRMLDATARADELALAMAGLIQRGGLTPPATRAIARSTGISVGTLSHQFETRERLINVLCSRLARAYTEEQEELVRWHGVAGLMPDPGDRDATLLLRGRMALDEVARTSDHVAVTLERVDGCERALLARLRAGERLSLPARPSTEVASTALLAGLRIAVYRRSDPLPVQRAVELLERELGRGGGSSPAV